MPPSYSSTSSQATSSQANTTSVQVAVRIRPSNAHDAISIPTRFQRTIISSAPPSTVVVEPSALPPSSSANNTGAAPSSAANNPLAKRQTFAFDQVHDQESTQNAIYTNTAAPLVARFLQGFNCTVLAYGQTSSGKTYTMTGIDLDMDPNDPTNGMGIIPRAVATVFGGVQQLKLERGNAWTCTLKGSFIEIYNEDLIDLLAIDDGSGSRREVQIREEKDGTILWSGLREVPVRSTADVMALIKQGSSIRRTNETDMNAQSSRSHAIFSLTLTQKKYTGTLPSRANGVASGRTSPMPPTSPGSPAPSRLARPSSMYVGSPGRVGSPTFGRPGTPSFATAMNRANGVRPASSLSLRPESPTQEETPSSADGSGSWVTVVSKFHFVDLAGSERLKRTAAQGERIKEGISINSGLLALGNVISALGDPSRSRSLAPGAGQHIHVPYRDSKLTRLLQDSLGGNAHTLMIACVSPAEWNAAETVNTLKYANRARNIKNRAEVREREEGWDDLEWLQGMITKLRKEVKALKEGGATPGGLNGIAEEGSASSGSGTANKMMLQKYHELQGMHEDLRARFTQADGELRRARQELEEVRSPSGGSNLKRYEEIVAPVIEQYEKTISAMEAELKLNRTALAHTNEMYQEQEQELETLRERRVTSEAYIEELRARVSKLVEREASTESYVRDLEIKLKSYADSSAASEDSMIELRRELARQKASEESTATYISDLEARLARSDSDLAVLCTQVETLESQLDRKSSEISRLEAKVDELLAGGTAKKDLEEWRLALEDRERKVQEMEKQMEDLQKIRAETAAERARLGNVVQGVEQRQRDLEQELEGGGGFLRPESRDIDGLSVTSASETGHDETPILRIDTDVTTQLPLPPSPTASIRSLATIPPDVLRGQLLALRKTHSSTLEELATVSGKYRDALKEISDLAGQIAEVKTQLNNQQSTPSAPASSQGDPHSDGESGVLTPLRNWSPSSPGGTLARRRRGTGAGVGLVRSDTSPGGIGVNGNGGGPQGRKLFFKHAASAESLHARSQSYSPLQQDSPSSLPFGRSQRADPRMMGSGGDGVVESLLSPTLPPRLSPLRMSLSLGNEGRSVESLEKEIMRLQEVLKEREAEITVLEKNIQEIEKARTPSRKSSSSSLKPNADVNDTASAPMTPQTKGRFEELQKSLEVTPDLASPEGGGGGEDSMTRLNELMRAMAQKESLHHQQVTAMNEELDQVRRQHKELEHSTRETLANLSTELDTTRTDLIASKEQQLKVATQLESLKERERVLLDERRIAEEKHANSIDILKGEHEQELRKLRTEHSERVSATAEEHEDAIRYATAKSRREAEVAAAAHLEFAVSNLKTEHEAEVAKLIEQHETELRQHEVEVEAVLARTRADHERTISRMRAEHEEALQARDTAEIRKADEDLVAQYETTIKALEAAHTRQLAQESSASNTIIGRLKQEHQEELASLRSQHEDQLRGRLDQADAALRTARDDHEAAITKVKAEHEDALARKAVEHGQLLQRAKDEHGANLRQAEIALEGSLSESQMVTANAMKQLQEEHAAALSRRDASADEDLKNLAAEHQRALLSKEEDHQARLDRLASDHQAAVTREQERHYGEVKRLQSELAALGEEQALSLSKVMQELDTVQTAAETGRSKLVADHEEALLEAKAEHQAAMTEAQKALIDAQDSHTAALDAARVGYEQARGTDVQRHKESLAALERVQTAERETMQKAHDLLVSEVERQQAAFSQVQSEKDQVEESRRTEVEDLKSRLATMEEHLTSVMKERAANANEVEQLRAELAHHKVHQASNRESLSQELERHRSVLADLQHDLQRAKDAKDTLMAERQRQDAVVRELQAQLATAKAHKREGSGDSSPTPATTPSGSRMRPNGIPPAKLPPLTAPPSVPPPATPTSSTISGGFPVDVSANGRDSTSSTSHSRAASPDERGTPSTSVVMSPSHPSQLIDPKVAALIEEQAKHLEEQEAMIKTLNKQLTHCEADLQAHMDLVATLEASLTDSERSLRKARVQSNELVKERDSYQQQINGLRQQVQEAQREASSLRRSVAEEKLTLEHRLDEERKAKERARAQLDSRMDEMSKRKSKFVCL